MARNSGLRALVRKHTWKCGSLSVKALQFSDRQKGTPRAEQRASGQRGEILGARLHGAPRGEVCEVRALRRGELRDLATGLVEAAPPEDALDRAREEAGVRPRVRPPLLPIIEGRGQDLCPPEGGHHRVQPQELEDVVRGPPALLAQLEGASIMRGVSGGGSTVLVRIQ